MNPDFVPALIGKGGESIKNLRKELGIAIDLGAKGTGKLRSVAVRKKSKKLRKHCWPWQQSTKKKM